MTAHPTRQGRLDAHFGTEATFWNDLYAGHDVLALIHGYRLDLALRWVDRLRLPVRSSTLEVGCGAGLLSVALASRGLDVDATDPSEAMLDVTRRSANREGQTERMRISVADVHALPFPDESFRLVVGLGVLPWIDELEVALSELGRVLVPGGHLILSINNRSPLHAMADPVRLPILAPLRDGVRHRLLAIWTEPRAPRPRPIGFARPAEFAVQLKAHGLDMIGSEAFGYGPFTLLGRPLLPDRLAVGLERRLQSRAERGDRWLAAVASQYLVLAQRPPN